MNSLFSPMSENKLNQVKLEYEIFSFLLEKYFESYPSYRFGQLFSNVNDLLERKGIEPFNATNMSFLNQMYQILFNEEQRDIFSKFSVFNECVLNKEQYLKQNYDFRDCFEILDDYDDNFLLKLKNKEYFAYFG